MRYLWINPVAAARYHPQELEQADVKRGFRPVSCKEDHLAAVREKYRMAVEDENGCVVDMRCPLGAEYLRRNYGGEDLRFPPIHPILVHSALELCGRCGEGDELWMTTPCASLRDYGAALQLPGVVFCTWRDFAREQGIDLEPLPLEASPIPPGFFQGLGVGVETLASREEIDRCFAGGRRPAPRLIEVLYCREGCHNGDGV